MQELVDLQKTVRCLAEQLNQLERSAGVSAPPRGRPIATLQAITIGGVQQPFFSSDQLGPLCFENPELEQQFFSQLHGRETDAAGGDDDDQATQEHVASSASRSSLAVAELVTMSCLNEVAAASPLQVHQPHHLPWRCDTERAKLHR